MDIPVKKTALAAQSSFLLVLPDDHTSDGALHSLVAGEINRLSQEPDSLWHYAEATVIAPPEMRAKGLLEIVQMGSEALPHAILVGKALGALKSIVDFINWCRKICNSLAGAKRVEIHIGDVVIVIPNEADLDVKVLERLISEALAKRAAVNGEAEQPGMSKKH